MIEDLAGNRVIETTTTYGIPMETKDPFRVALSLLRQSDYRESIALAEAFDRARALLAGHVCGCQSPQCERVNRLLTEPPPKECGKP